MGGHGHEEHHKVKIPDYRIYKVEDAPELLRVQEKLAKIGLKDPWLRNEVWRYDPILTSGSTVWRRMWPLTRRGFKAGVALTVASIAGEMIYKMVRGDPPSGEHGGHEHKEDVRNLPPNIIPEFIDEEEHSSVFEGFSISDKAKSKTTESSVVEKENESSEFQNRETVKDNTQTVFDDFESEKDGESSAYRIVQTVKENEILTSSTNFESKENAKIPKESLTQTQLTGSLTTEKPYCEERVVHEDEKHQEFHTTDVDDDLFKVETVSNSEKKHPDYIDS